MALFVSHSRGARGGRPRRVDQKRKAPRNIGVLEKAESANVRELCMGRCATMRSKTYSHVLTRETAEGGIRPARHSSLGTMGLRATKKEIKAPRNIGVLKVSEFDAEASRNARLPLMSKLNALCTAYTNRIRAVREAVDRVESTKK